MSINGIRPSAEEIDCLTTIGESQPVRSFLRLPSQEGPGLLRLVDMTSVDPGEGRVEDVKLNLLEGNDVTLGCLPNCFVKSLQFSMPVPAAYPIELTINSAILGSDNPDATYSSLTIANHQAVRFLDQESSSMDDIALAGAIRMERASVPFGDHQLQLFEIAERERSGDAPEVTLTWWMEIVLTGDSKTLEDWTDYVMPALCLMAFCLDEPMLPERIYSMTSGGLVDFHLRWRDCSAPSRPSPLMTMSGLGDRFTDVASAWGHLFQEAPELMWNLTEYQLRRNAKSLGDAFLLLARCLELYFSYSDQYDSVVRPADSHNAIVSEAMGSLSTDLREREGSWIERALKNANRKSMVDQAQSVLDSFGGEVLRFCGIPVDSDEFAKAVRDTRNFFTHAPSNRPARVPEGRGLVALQHRLWFLLRACILREMGFEESEIVQMLQRVGQSYYVIRG